MGPLDSIGPYAETTITTRKSDVTTTTDNQHHWGHLVVAILLLGPCFWIVGFMGLFVWAHLAIIVPAGIIGLAIWACGYYGTNDSLLARITYRTTPAQRDRIRLRLSDAKRF